MWLCLWEALRELSLSVWKKGEQRIHKDKDECDWMGCVHVCVCVWVCTFVCMCLVWQPVQRVFVPLLGQTPCYQIGRRTDGSCLPVWHLPALQLKMVTLLCMNPVGVSVTVVSHYCQDQYLSDVVVPKLSGECRCPFTTFRELCIYIIKPLISCLHKRAVAVILHTFLRFFYST